MRAVGEAWREEARGVEPLEAREESSRGDARGERSRSSSLVQVHRTRQMGLNSGRQRQLRNDGDGTARRWEHSNDGSAAGDTMAEQQEVLTMQEAELQGVDYAVSLTVGRITLGNVVELA